MSPLAVALAPRYGSDPRTRPIPRKTVLTAGTPKGTYHIPGYMGFLPTNTRNPYVARVESGKIRSNDRSHITDQYHVNTLFYSGHEPLSVVNKKGAVDPGNRSMTLGYASKLIEIDRNPLVSDGF